MKKRGILLHITSLPGDFGIGDLGYDAYRFADYLAKQGYTYWQILPLYHPGYGNSPYNPVSAFAYNPYLISPELLYEDGLIDKPDLEAAKLPRNSQVAYDSVYRNKEQLLQIATKNYLSTNDITEYIESNALYLKPYLAYNILCKLYGDCTWELYRPEHRHFSEQLYEQLLEEYHSSMLQTACAQILVQEQLFRFRSYLREKKIILIGDMPLYLSYHSSDVWANQHLFDLDAAGNRLSVAGVPPDAFAEEGQLWGNPLYRWSEMQADDFRLFQDRIAHALRYLDLLRLDHFIGYVNYWSVPCPLDPKTGEPTLPLDATAGSWINALGEEFFSVVTNRFGIEPFIAEDLGILNEEVCRIRDLFGFPGMIILQFCFEESVPKVEEYPTERFIYTGTHDNPTAAEWYAGLAEDSPSRLNFQQFLNENPSLFDAKLLRHKDPGQVVPQLMITIAEASGCQRVIIPLQDLLGLGAEARMNIPGTALGNWQWRLVDFPGDLSGIDHPSN